MATDPIRPTDTDARALARRLLDTARFAALGVIDPDDGAPSVTRIALATTENGAPMTLVSDLSPHTRALRANPVCSLLVGEPGQRGDPLTHPRITIAARAAFVARDSATHPALRDRYLACQPKAKLYIDFGDFHIVTFSMQNGALNGGFGRAFRLTGEDLLP